MIKLREPQIRILRILAERNAPVPRSDVAGLLGYKDSSMIGYYAGYWKDESNDRPERIATLWKLGLCKMEKPGREMLYQITAKGRVYFEQLDNSDAHPGARRRLSKVKPKRRESFVDPEDADDEYNPADGDRRPLIQRQIKQRRGQQSFRQKLCIRYGGRCLVTGCAVLDVLEAAHIKPYRREEDNNSGNGLLLRSDIHTLFDLDLLGIEPDTLRIQLHPQLVAPEYKQFAGKALRCPKAGKRPSTKALALRYGVFKRGLPD